MKDRLRLFFCDHLSILRGKYLPGSRLGADGETRFCQSTFGVHFDKDLLPSPGSKMLEGLPDMVAKWRAEDIREGWEPATKVVMCDLHDAAGAPLGPCGRGALKRAVATWQARGLAPKVGLELEAYAFERGPDGALTPYEAPGGHVYGTGPAADPAGFMDAVWEEAEAAGFRLEMMTTEYDNPQFEFTLAYDDAVKAVDDLVLFRLMAREVALKRGLVLTFMPKPIPEKGGSGLHVNFSFAGEDGRNALSGGEGGEPEAMNDLARECVAGLVHHHEGLAGLLAPTVNSYRRLRPASLSGFWKNWGGDHRNVTTRVSAEGGAKARIEHRMADAAANPYTAVAAVLQAARLGVERGYPLPPAERGDGFESQDATSGVAETLEGALDALEADSALVEAVGAELVANQLFMRRAEVEKLRGANAATERDFYIHFI